MAVTHMLYFSIKPQKFQMHLILYTKICPEIYHSKIFSLNLFICTSPLFVWNLNFENKEELPKSVRKLSVQNEVPKIKSVQNLWG